MRKCTIIWQILKKKIPQILKNTANIENIVNMIDSTETLD